MERDGGGRVGEVEREMVKVASPADGARVFPSAPGRSGEDVCRRRYIMAEKVQGMMAVRGMRAVSILPLILI